MAPLWLQLRQHHADLAPQWRDNLLATTFEQRRAGLISKAAAGLLVLLATSGGDDIGYCVSTIAADRTGEVDSLYVTPTHRGRGVGHALMSETMIWFGKRSARSIALDVITGNDAALRFYKHYGFAPRTVRMVSHSDKSRP